MLKLPTTFDPVQSLRSQMDWSSHQKNLSEAAAAACHGNFYWNWANIRAKRWFWSKDATKQKYKQKKIKPTFH